MTDRLKPTWPALWPVLFVGTLVVFAAGVPFGLDRVGAASSVAAGLGLDSTSQEPAKPLAILVMRLVGYLPVGDAPARANLSAALFAALALALLGRLCANLLLAFRPPPHARQEQHHFLQEPFLAAGAVLAAGMSFSFFHTATSAGSGAATLALLAGAWLSALPLLRGEGGPRHGFFLAGLAGLAAGVDPVAGPLLWPLTFGL